MPAPWFAYGYGKITQGFPKHSFGGKGTCRCSSWGPRGSHNQSLWCRELETQTIWHHFLLLVFHKMESSLNLGCPTLSNYRRCSFLICLLQHFHPFSSMFIWLVVEPPTPLKDDGVRQWEGLSMIIPYIMVIYICRYIPYVMVNISHIFIVNKSHVWNHQPFSSIFIWLCGSIRNPRWSKGHVVKVAR